MPGILVSVFFQSLTVSLHRLPYRIKLEFNAQERNTKTPEDPHKPDQPDNDLVDRDSRIEFQLQPSHSTAHTQG